MRESRTCGSVRGARDETRVPTAPKARVHHAARRGGGSGSVPLAARMHEGRLIQNMAGQIIARHSNFNPVATLLH